MKLSNYNLDDMDLDFIMEVQDELKKYFGEDANNILLKLSFLKRITENPDYVYHYDECYWADIIKDEYENIISPNEVMESI